MNSRQRRKLTHARKLHLELPTETKSQTHTSDTQPTQPQSTVKGSLAKISRHAGRPGKFALGVLAFAGTLVTLNSFRFDVSIDPYLTLNPNDPLETRFVLTNQGSYTINKVRYSCEFPGMKIPGVPAEDNVVGMNTVMFEQPEMEAHEKVSLYCGGSSMTAEWLNPTEPMLQIRVSYRPSFWPFTKEGSARFLLKTDRQGSAHWLPFGRAKDLKDLKK